MEFLNEELIYISAGEGPEKLESFEVGRDRWARRVFGTARPAVAPYPKTISAKSILDNRATVLLKPHWRLSRVSSHY